MWRGRGFVGRGMRIVGRGEGMRGIGVEGLRD
jgi:hypothetical protein